MIYSNRIKKLENQTGSRAKKLIIVALPSATDPNQKVWIVNGKEYSDEQYQLWKKKNKIKTNTITPPIPSENSHVSDL